MSDRTVWVAHGTNNRPKVLACWVQALPLTCAPTHEVWVAPTNMSSFCSNVSGLIILYSLHSTVNMEEVIEEREKDVSRQKNVGGITTKHGEQAHCMLTSIEIALMSLRPLAFVKFSIWVHRQGEKEK